MRVRVDNGSEGSEPQWVARTFLTRRWRSGFRSLPGEAASLARREPECEPGVAVPMGLLGKISYHAGSLGTAPAHSRRGGERVQQRLEMFALGATRKQAGSGVPYESTTVAAGRGSPTPTE